MPLLTNRESEIFNYILNFTSEKGYPPSVREIGAAVGLKSSSTVHVYLSNLEEKGYIRRDPSKPRALEILIKSDDNTSSKQDIVSEFETTNVPLLGRVAAGLPIFADENVEEYFPLPKTLASDGDSFMLRVTGQSMIGAGIFDGDYVIVKSQRNARNGEIVVALIDDEATVKRIFVEDEYIRLEPENPAFAPILSNTATVIGKVTGLIRRIH